MADAQQPEMRVVSILQVDLMYYSTARRCLQAAKADWPKVVEQQEAFDALQVEAEPIWKQVDDQDDASVCAAERIAKRIENQHFSVGHAYAPVLENLALTQILCASSLEAHINAIGAGRLSRKDFNEFDRLSVNGKWLFLPKLLALEGFESGAEPFQSFKNLIGWRNDLMHYRHKRENWDYKAAPGFLKELGLTIPQAETSLRTTRVMVQTIQEQLRELEDVSWDLDAPGTYFDIDFVYLNRKKG